MQLFWDLRMNSYGFSSLHGKPGIMKSTGKQKTNIVLSNRKEILRNLCLLQLLQIPFLSIRGQSKTECNEIDLGSLKHFLTA